MASQKAKAGFNRPSELIISNCFLRENVTEIASLLGKRFSRHDPATNELDDLAGRLNCIASKFYRDCLVKAAWPSKSELRNYIRNIISKCEGYLSALEGLDAYDCSPAKQAIKAYSNINIIKVKNGLKSQISRHEKILDKMPGRGPFNLPVLFNTAGELLLLAQDYSNIRNKKAVFKAFFKRLRECNFEGLPPDCIPTEKEISSFLHNWKREFDKYFGPLHTLNESAKAKAKRKKANKNWQFYGEGFSE